MNQSVNDEAHFPFGGEKRLFAIVSCLKEKWANGKKFITVKMIGVQSGISRISHILNLYEYARELVGNLGCIYIFQLRTLY